MSGMVWDRESSRHLSRTVSARISFLHDPRREDVLPTSFVHCSIIGHIGQEDIALHRSSQSSKRSILKTLSDFDHVGETAPCLH